MHDPEVMRSLVVTGLSRRRAGGLDLTWGADQGGEEGLVASYAL